jgi:hypothetical protein
VAGSDAQLVQNGTFNLGSGTQLLEAKAGGDVLQAGVYQKGAAVHGKAVVLPDAGAQAALTVSVGVLTAQ